MPSFGRQLDDGQIAAVLSYVRGAWGRPAAAIAPDDVARMRDDLSGRAD
jgi:mono/diheme cytochrome c family protein